MEDDFRSAVVSTFAEQHPILAVLPFDNINGGALRFNREGTLPGTGFRAINAGYTASEGVLDPVVDPLMILGGDLDVDKFLVKTQGPGARAGRIKMKLKSLAHEFAHNFVKGSNASNGAQFDGLQVRAIGSQLIAAGASSGGDVLSLAKMDALLSQVPGATHIIMSEAMLNLLKAAARTPSVGGYVTFSTDSFGRAVTSYDGRPIVAIGGPGHLYNTLSFSEANPNGGGAVGTSIYAIRVDDGGVTGIQAEEPEVTDFGEIHASPVIRARFEWYCGTSVADKFSIGRLWGIKTGAVVA
jgi:hypothetical protein